MALNNNMRKSVNFISRLISARFQSPGALKQMHFASSRRTHHPKFPASPKAPHLGCPAALFSSRRLESTEAEKQADCSNEIGDGNQVQCKLPSLSFCFIFELVGLCVLLGWLALLVVSSAYSSLIAFKCFMVNSWWGLLLCIWKLNVLADLLL